MMVETRCKLIERELSAEGVSWLRDGHYFLSELCGRIGDSSQDWLITLAERNDSLDEVEAARLERIQFAFYDRLEAVDAMLYQAGFWLEWTQVDDEWAPLRGAPLVEILFHSVRNRPSTDEELNRNVLVESQRALKDATECLLAPPIDLRTAAFAALKTLRIYTGRLIGVRDVIKDVLDCVPAKKARRKSPGRTANPNHEKWFEEISRDKAALGLTWKEAVKLFNETRGTNKYTVDQVKQWGKRSRKSQRANVRNRAG